MKRIAYYGGSFDPVHRGHLKIADKITDAFELDEFVFVPAFHAPHKTRLKPTSAFHRYAMLCLATQNKPKIKVSKIELEAPEKPYTIETLTKILNEKPDDEIFFVMGADSWEEITSWKEWEKVLSIVNIIVVTRPGYEIGLSHVTDEIQKRIINLREKSVPGAVAIGLTAEQESIAKNQIFVTHKVKLDISSTNIRRMIREREIGLEKFVSKETYRYIKKYGLYE